MNTMQVIIKVLLTIMIIAICYFGISRVWKNEIDLVALLTKPFSFIPTKQKETILLKITHLRRDLFAYLNAGTLTNIDINLVVKITNNDDKAIEIIDYKVQLFADGIWEEASPIAFLNKNNLFHITNSDYRNATRIKLEIDMFDLAVQNKQIQPGETIVGMVPIETKKKLGKIEEVKFALKDIMNRRHEFKIKLEDVGVEGKEYLQSFGIEVLDKNVDLSGFLGT